MNLYLIIFTAGTYKVEQVYEKHKDLFVELEKHFPLHLVNYTDSESIPSHEYKMAFIASGGVENAVVRFFSILPYPITLLTDGLNNSLAAALEISAWIQSRDMKEGTVVINGHDILEEPEEAKKRHWISAGAAASVHGYDCDRISETGSRTEESSEKRQRGYDR